jgi:amino acid transporter
VYLSQAAGAVYLSQAAGAVYLSQAAGAGAVTARRGAAQVDNPARTFPRALVFAIVIVPRTQGPLFCAKHRWLLIVALVEINAV